MSKTTTTSGGLTDTGGARVRPTAANAGDTAVQARKTSTAANAGDTAGRARITSTAANANQSGSGTTEAGATVRMTGSLEPRSGWTAERCPIAGALDVVGTRSAFLILREACYGTTRFDDFAQRVGISEPVAAARLRELVRDGLLEHVPYREPGQRTRQGYRLTAKGAELLPTLVALMQWGDRWLEDRGRVELRHRDCGEPVGVTLRCAAGHEVPSGRLDLARR
jgi:DNA-binding HxlR family transcriptional regulator